MKSANPDPTQILKEHDQQPGRQPKTQHERDTTQPTLGIGIG